MEEKSKLGVAIVAAGMVLGLLGDQLLRVGPWGLNAGIWVGELVLILLYFTRAYAPDAGPGSGRIFLLIAGFALLFAWHDSLALKFLAFVAVAGALVLLSVRAHGRRLADLPLLHHLLELAAVAVSTMAGPLLLLFKDIRWSEFPKSGRSKQLFAVARGLAIALPLVLLFGALFVSADATFEEIVNRLFDIDLASLIGHCFMVGFCAWIAGGYLRRVFMQPETGFESFTPTSRPSIGVVETALVLGSLDLLFLLFVMTQVGYLFGGSAHVTATPDLTLAQYFRRGFFELVTVAALSLPLLLGVHWLLRREHPAHERMFTWLAGILMILLFVIMGSAANRLYLYQREFGITEERLYAFAFMAWLACLLVWFAVTVLRGRRDRFAFGAIVSAFAAILVLEAANPDALIVGVNSSRAAEGKRFDARYLAGLSLDAVPALLEAMPSYQKEDRGIIAAHLVQELGRHGEDDWRTWSLSKSAALRLIGGQQENLTLSAADAPANRPASQAKPPLSPAAPAH